MSKLSWSWMVGVLPWRSLSLCPAPASAQVQTPEQFFGFTIGADGELARYPKVLEYFQLLAKQTDRVKYEEIGKTTMGQSVRAGDDQLAGEPEAARPAGGDQPAAGRSARADRRRRGEAGGGRAAVLSALRDDPLDRSGQRPVDPADRAQAGDRDRARPSRRSSTTRWCCWCRRRTPTARCWSSITGTRRRARTQNRVYPDLYHKYAGHDDNRDWFMFTQKETRLMVEKVQNAYKPAITHDMHQQGSTGSRIFVPPFQEPYDVNIHPILAQQQAQVGQAMATALIGEGKEGVAFNEAYDLWTPARQYMVYHGQPRILTEIASVNLADPFVNPAGQGRAARAAGNARQLPEALFEGRLAAVADRRLRLHRGARRHRRTSRSITPSSSPTSTRCTATG